MAKELPYFKFEPSQWENGNIQLCSFEAQGIFINLCSVYWQRLGDLPYKLALQKVCGGNATALRSLCDEGVIKVIDEMICIDFLNEQLSEFENARKTNSENARSGWQKRKKDATAMRPHSDPNAIREEKRREEKKREEQRNADAPPFEGELLERWFQWEKHRKEKKAPITPTARKQQIKLLGGRPPNEALAILEYSLTNGYTGLFPEKAKSNGNRNNTKGGDQPTTAVIERGKSFGLEKGFSRSGSN